ncbi:MAG: hypothetical protein WC284_14935 [Candidimonas sp.]
MKLTEIENIESDKLKFWYNVKTGEFIEHDIEYHHVKMVAKNLDKFGVDKSKIIHNPYVAGSPNKFGNPDKDDNYWTREDADNDDIVSKVAMDAGWVRGGHYIDLMSYHEYDEIRHDDGIYLQGKDIKDVRKALTDCLKRWPEIEWATVEFGGKMINLRDEDLDSFAKRGILPRG